MAAEMPEQRRALLTALADNKSKADAARRNQRLTQLNIAYGNALIAARGFGAPETTEAFARARESGVWRQRCGRTIGGHLWFMGWQRHARRIAVDARARGGLP